MGEKGRKGKKRKKGEGGKGEGETGKKRKGEGCVMVFGEMDAPAVLCPPGMPKVRGSKKFFHSLCSQTCTPTFKIVVPPMLVNYQ